MTAEVVYLYPWQRPAGISAEFAESTRRWIAAHPAPDYDCRTCGGDPLIECGPCMNRFFAAHAADHPLDRILQAIKTADQLPPDEGDDDWLPGYDAFDRVSDR